MNGMSAFLSFSVILLRMIRFLFLYTELAEYFMACARKLHAQEGAEVHIVRWPVNPEAPFEFTVPEGMGTYDRTTYNDEALRELVARISPDRIFCSGWIDQGYLKVLKDYAGRIPTVLILDNQWKASLRQQIARIWARWRIRPLFSHVWVPGERQAEYARKLGFKEERILDGFYVADLDRFNKVYAEREKLDGPFIYLGRYVEHKGIRDLWNAFETLVEEGKTGERELWCCGTGELYPERPDHPKIRHLGFLQPEEMPEVMLQSSVFILPSHFEPWGVVVQEFAAAGAPLLLSDAVGAASAFLEEGGNGSLFPTGDRKALKERLEDFLRMDEASLWEMGCRSHELAAHPSLQDWANKALSIDNIED